MPDTFRYRRTLHRDELNMPWLAEALMCVNRTPWKAYAPQSVRLIQMDGTAQDTDGRLTLTTTFQPAEAPSAWLFIPGLQETPPVADFNAFDFGELYEPETADA